MPKSVLERIRYAHPSNGLSSLNANRIAQLQQEVISNGACLVVIDAFSSAFPFTRINDADQVAQVIASLRSLAETGAAVLVLDHTPKPSPRDPGGRGLLGSQIKSAGARAVHLLSGVPKKDVDGRDVLRFETHKNNLAPVGAAIGIERIWASATNGLGETVESVRFELFNLNTQDSTDSSLERAKRCVLEVLRLAQNAVGREVLIGQVCEQAAVSARTVERAIGLALSDESLEVIRLPQRGAPRLYRLAGLESPELELAGLELTEIEPVGLERGGREIEMLAPNKTVFPPALGREITVGGQGKP